MKKHDVQIGATYLVKIAGNLVPVKLTRELSIGGQFRGWEGVSEKTGKTIRIKSAQRLRHRKCLPDVAHKTNPGMNPGSHPEAKTEPQRDTGEPPQVVAAAGTKRNAKPMSLLDAAIHVLSPGTDGSPVAMRCKEIVDLAVARGWWTPRAGKTPVNTLYATISREIKTKGDTCRFVKTERGKFALKDRQCIGARAVKNPDQQ